VDVRQLSFKGVRRGQCGSAQHVNQVLVIGAKTRTRLEVTMQRGSELRISCCVGERCIIKQFLEWPERGVEVGQPEQYQFLQRHGAMRHAGSRAGEPISGGLLTTIDVDGGKMPDKTE
jgi:hypothetical protein